MRLSEPTAIVEQVNSEGSFRDADFAIRGAWAVEKGRNRRTMLIGWYGFRMNKTEEFSKHGFKDEADYRDKVGISRAVWGRALRLASFFENLSLDEFTAMTAENAEILSSLPESYRCHPQWLEYARTLKAEDLKRKCLREKAYLGGVPVSDMRVTYKLPVFEAQRTVIEGAVEKFRKENGLLDKGTALEWMAMESSERKTFVNFLLSQIGLLKKALRDGTAKEALGDHILAIADLLQNIRLEKEKK